MVNVVYFFQDSSILICQNADFKSKLEKWPEPTKLSKASWILGGDMNPFCTGIETLEVYTEA